MPRRFSLAALALQPNSIVIERLPTPEEARAKRLTADLATVGADLLTPPASQATAGEVKPDILDLLRHCKSEARRAAEMHARELAELAAIEAGQPTATADQECPLDLALVGLPQVRPLVIDQGGELAVEEQVGGAPEQAVALAKAARAERQRQQRVTVDAMARAAGVRTEREYVLRLLRTHQRLAPMPDWSTEESAWRSVLANDQWARVEMALMRMLPPAGRKGPGRGWRRMKR